MKTVMLLGSGVSRAARSGGALSKRPPLDADFFEIARTGKHVLRKSVVDTLNALVGDYSKALIRSLETSATYLYLKAVDSPSGSSYHTGFLSLLTLLQQVLAVTTNDLKLGRRSLIYRFILCELRKLEHPEDLTIITFNYDLVIENALQEITLNNRAGVFVFPGCYRLDDFVSSPGARNHPEFNSISKEHEGVAILKLHGSMSWQSKHTSDSPRPSALFHPNREIHVINSRHIVPSLRWRPGARLVYLKPIIVPPVSGKRNMMHSSMQKLWNLSAAKLEEADRIIIAGYSCPPLDLEARILLSENLRKNSSKKIYVIDPNHESAAKFVDLCGVNHTTIYSSISEWVADDVAI